MSIFNTTKTSVLNTLDAKSVALETDVVSAKANAASYREAANAEDLRATLSEKQRVAVAQALDILEAAGVII
jgi:hypothetical protein